MKAKDYDRSATDIYHAVRQLVEVIRENGGTAVAATHVSPADGAVLSGLLKTLGDKFPWMVLPPEIIGS